MLPIEQDVLAANAAFYRAFRERDATAMDRLWAQLDGVACVHPGMKPIIGREAVMRSWRGILAHPGAPPIVCTEAEVQIFGVYAFVTCLEGIEGEPGSLAATNTFVHEDEEWRVVHHQAGPLSSKERRRVVLDPEEEELDLDPQLMN